MPNSSKFPRGAPPRNIWTKAGFSPDVRGNILFAFAVGIVLALVYIMRDTLFLLYVSALFAVVLNPLIQWITGLRIKGWSPNRPLAIAMLLLVVAGCAAVFFAFVAPPILQSLRAFAQALPTRGPKMLHEIKELPFSSRLNLGVLLAKLQGSASSLAGYLFLSLSGWASRIVDIVAVIILTVYFMLEGDSAYRWALSLVPRRVRPRLDSALLRAETRMGRWLLGQGTLMLIMGIASIIVFALLRIRYAYALGVLMGVLNIIPILGGLVTMVLVVLVAAVDSWGKALGAIVFYVIYTQIENSYLTPRIMRSRVHLPGLAVLIALLIGTKLAGVVGAMVAVPTAVLVSVLTQEYLVRKDTMVGEVPESPREPGLPLAEPIEEAEEPHLR